MWEAAAATSAKKAVATLATTLEMPVRIVDVENPALGSSAANHSRLGTYAKLNVWRLNSLYVVYIDVDTLAVRNPAEAFLALADDRVQIAYCGTPRRRKAFNSGVMALRPSGHVYNQITRLLRHGGHFNDKDPTEQDLIVQYFSTLPKETSRPLNLTFNVRAWLWAASTMPIDAVIVHRSGQGKPWTQILHPGSWPHNLPAEYTMPEWATRLWRATLSDLLLATCSLNSTPTTPPARCSAGRSLRVRNAFRGSPKHGLGSSACRHWQALTLLLFRNTVHFASCVSQATEVNFTTLADPC